MHFPFILLLLANMAFGGLIRPLDSGRFTSATLSSSTDDSTSHTHHTRAPALQARDDSSTYTLVKNAADQAGKTLKDGKWYYFTLCQLHQGTPTTSLPCAHYMFLAGQVSITAEGGNFWGEVWHVKWEVEPDEKWWTLHRFNFARRDRQAVFYGGRTTEQKASESNLQKLSDKWLDKYRYCRERYPKKANCKGYYDYMASKMSDSWL